MYPDITNCPPTAHPAEPTVLAAPARITEETRRTSSSLTPAVGNLWLLGGQTVAGFTAARDRQLLYRRHGSLGTLSAS
jgi:hypothetical protein